MDNFGLIMTSLQMASGMAKAGGALSIVTGPNFSGKSVYLKTVGECCK